MQQKWDERYKEQEFAYGKEPNLFFKEWLAKFSPGAILMPADGEGRNGVFAAQLGWKVTSFDLSVEGQAKALQLARDKHVTLSYIVGDLEHLHFENETFDAIGLIYAHFSGDKKADFHKQLDNYLKPGGIIIFEAFSKSHLAAYGPKEMDMLYSKEEIMVDFGNYEVLVLAEEEILLDEGKYHIGKGSVIRFIGKKKSPMA
ncbi:methyltransferase domain-containing protein [Chitinophaga sp. SYP-B3965]|uniref:class I SAM-dependent methyltransferase n=1 Tax=Chitinophaga sp. SYP-B3965 TaxID=2663120 RepID=UPI001299EC30|nr:class I SAM-dependent methyltransferase [Chitinophaga sp. SYP-B3965]MRG45141.1 methyltransferase domain-containing protein [Chitinophaga sp. SYP-B3965]